jgi:hypothetical protein
VKKSDPQGVLQITEQEMTNDSDRRGMVDSDQTEYVVKKVINKAISTLTPLNM